MPHDSTTEAAVTAAAVATLAHLQTMKKGTAAVFVEQPGLGGSGVGAYKADATDDRELGLFEERRTPPPSPSARALSFHEPTMTPSPVGRASPDLPQPRPPSTNPQSSEAC